MRPSTTLVSLTLVGIVLAVSPFQNLTEVQASTPECARRCSAPQISGLTCKPTTVEELADCLCPNSTARRKITACVLESCTGMDILLASQPSKIYCAPYPVPSRSGEVRTAAIVLLAVTVPFVVGRAWSRMAIMKSLWWDDYTLALSSTILIANLILNIPLSNHGLGKHGWDVDPHNAVSLQKMFYFAQIAYVSIQVITKVSILLCFLRIFTQRWFRYAVYVSLALEVLHGTIFLLLVMFRCNPINLSWDRTVEGTCMSVNLITYVGAGFSIVADFWIMALPIPVLKSLQVTRGKKLVLIGMFSVGSLACVTSMIRLKHIGNFGDMTDPTWDNVDISIWSVIENAVAVICACLPALRPLLNRVLPRVFGSSQQKSRSGYGTQDSTIGKRGTGARRLVEDNEGAYDGAGMRRSSRGTEIFGTRDDTVTESGSSFNFARAESQEGIRLDTVVSVEVEDIKRPEKGYVRKASFDS